MSVETALLSGPLLDDLHHGERDAFVQFYELLRLPVHNLVWRLMRGRGDAAAITSEVFLTAYRQMLLHDGPIDPRAWIYRVTVDVCSEHADDSGSGEWPPEPARAALGRAPARRGHDELAGNFEQALASVSGRHYLALLLKDIHGLRLDEIAAVLGLSGEAAKALLFRAREEFRRAFEEQSQGGRDQGCRLADQAAAGSVGRGMAADELRKLREHAEYCRRCRRTMRSWGNGVAGLALFLRSAPLPDSLQAVPVFGSAPVPSEPVVASGSNRAARVAGAGGTAGVLSRVFAGTGRALASRSTAYAVTFICLAASAGAMAYVTQHNWTRIVHVPQIVRVRELVPGPVRIVRAKPAQATPVGSKAVREPAGTAGIALATLPKPRTTTQSAVYRVPATTSTNDGPVVTPSKSGDAPATTAGKKHPATPASTATTNNGGTSHGTALLGHTARGNGKSARHRAHPKAGDVWANHDTPVTRHTGTHRAQTSTSRHTSKQHGSDHSSRPQQSGHPASSHSGTRHAGGHGGGSQGTAHAHGAGGGHAGHARRHK